MPHAALFVVQGCFCRGPRWNGWFQCRTRLCLWCKGVQDKDQEASASFNAARGFVCGARKIEHINKSVQDVSMPHAALFVVQGFSSKGSVESTEFQCRTRLCLWCKMKCIGYPSKITRFNAARGFVCGARAGDPCSGTGWSFQCRTRLCLWCKSRIAGCYVARWKFQCRTRLCLWCKMRWFAFSVKWMVSMPHAALFVVQVLSLEMML